jgi:hypothetical protein
MDTEIIIAIVVVAGVIAVAAAFLWTFSRNRSRRLAERFGPEYQRVVQDHGKRSEAERELRQREQRVERLRLKEIDPDVRRRFIDDWRRAQEHFVDDPAGALTEVDNIVGAVMLERGYPVQDFEQRAADISVDHPEVVSNYRAAHAIAVKQGGAGVTTEELRQAMIHYRALFSELVESAPSRV